MSDTEGRDAATLGAHIANDTFELTALFERALRDDSPGGREFVNSETQEIYAVWRRAAPRSNCGAQTLDLIHTATQCANGVYSDGFARKIVPLKRRMNVMDLYPEFDEAA
jgi:hypothetical protein